MTARHKRITPPIGRRGCASGASPGRNGVVLLTAAAFLLLLLAAAQGYVSFRAQYAFIDHTKRSQVPSMLEALGLDTGAVIFALLALSLARRGRPGTIERALNVACALGSMTMNLLAANLTSPRSVTVWVMPSVLYAFASDRLIAVVRRWMQPPGTPAGQEGSAWRAVGAMALWLLRLIFDPLGTLAGLRRWVLAITPSAPGTRPATCQLLGPRYWNPAPSERRADANGQPGHGDSTELAALPGRQDPQGLPEIPAPPPPERQALEPGEKKREALIRLYEEHGQAGDPRYGNQAKTAELAGEIAQQIGYHPGTARRELARYLTAQIAPEAEPESEAEAVA